LPITPASTHIPAGEVLAVITNNGDLDGFPKPGNLAPDSTNHDHHLKVAETRGSVLALIKNPDLTTGATSSEANERVDGTKTTPTIASAPAPRNTEQQLTGTDANSGRGKKMSKVKTFVGGFRPKGRTSRATSGPSHHSKGGKGSNCIIF